MIIAITLIEGTLFITEGHSISVKLLVHVKLSIAAHSVSAHTCFSLTLAYV